MSDALALLSASELVAGYRARRFSPVEVVSASLRRIHKLNPRVNAFCLVDDESALLAARASEQRWFSGAPVGLVDGVPTSVKDLLISKGWPTLRGSLAIPRDQPWVEDAPAVARLREQGAVFVGKTTTPEFGWKPVTDSAIHGITRNPWNLACTAGGSSGGAAVAAALGMGTLHLGTDAGGSIRIPASFCGVFGLKPNHARVPAYPASPNSSIAHVGPITCSVADAALMLTAMSGYDARDSYCLPQEQRDWRLGVERGLSDLRIAYAPTLNGVTVDPLVSACVRAAIDRLADLGAVICEEEPPLAGAEASFLTIYGAAVARVISGLSATQLDQVDPGLRAFATEGSRISIADYFAALKVREELTASLNAFFERYDALVLPMLPLVAFEAGKLVPKGGAFPSWYDWTPFSGPFNLTKVPAASIPCGFVGQMPVGLQVVAPMFHENVALRVCRAYECVQPIVRPSGL
jgi:aspartyl-tRNA(Asn)/glutamyl-tRNA(Gln) amidotransferase subunit A